MGSIDVVEATIIRDGLILLVRTEEHPKIWHFLGGRRENGEKVMDCLARKLQVELPGLRFRIGNFLGVYWGEVCEDGMIRLTVYRVSLWTKLNAGKIRLGGGIHEVKWVRNTGGLNLAKPTAEAIAVLKKRGDL